MEDLASQKALLVEWSKQLSAELRKAKNANASKAARTSGGSDCRAMHHVLHAIGIDAATSPTGRPQRLPSSFARMLVPYVLLIFALSDCNTEVALAYALGIGRGRRHLVDAAQRLDDEYCEAVSAGIEWTYILAPEAQLQGMFDEPRFYGSRRRIRRAALYVVEFELFWWTVRQNCWYGLAPAGSQLLQKAISSISCGVPLPIRDRMVLEFATCSSVARNWLTKWRRRWGGRIGVMPKPGPRVQRPELLPKASWLHLFLLWLIQPERRPT